jgi:hypothetical protein
VRERTGSALFEVRMRGRREPGRWTKRLAVIMHRQAGHVHGQRTGRSFDVDDDYHGAAFDAVTEGDETAARQTGPDGISGGRNTLAAVGAQNNS